MVDRQLVAAGRSMFAFASGHFVVSRVRKKPEHDFAAV
jgi:hypothetical protein